MEQPSSTSVVPTPSEPPRKARRLVDPSSGRWNQWSIVLLVAAVVAIIILIVPPVQLFARISWLGCTVVSPQSSTAIGPDGLTVSLADANSSHATLRLRMSRVAQDKLPAAALKALPAEATPFSSLYQMNACGSNQAPVVISVPASFDAAAADTLDVLAWDGKNWQWVGGQADISNGAVTAHTDTLPPSVMAVQSAQVAPVVAAEIRADATVSDRAAEDANEFAVTGMTFADDGTLQGNVADPPVPTDASHTMFTIVSSQSPQGATDPAVIEDMVTDAKARAAHVKALTDLATQSKYNGIVVDYRGVTSDARDGFTSFVNELAASLHKNKKLLMVVVPAPTQSERGDEWDTAGYDWKAIGASADVVEFDAPADPAAYGPSHRFEKALRWAIGEVNRAKLQVALSASSVKQTGNALQAISYEDALKPFNTISSSLSLSEVAPGTLIQLSLGNAPDLQYDDATRMYHYTVGASESVTSTIWIHMSAALAQKLSLPLKFGVRGVTVKGLAESNDQGDWTVLEQYQTQAMASVPAQLQVNWTVRAPDGTQLPGGTSSITDTTFAWTAPDNAGRFTIAAALPGSATRGELTIDVAQPTPTPAPTATPTPSPDITPTPAAGAVDKCPDGKFVADVTVPDGTQYDKGKEFTKTWKVQNSGACDWPEGTVLAYAAGEKMSAPDTVTVGVVKAGETKDISVPMKAPDKDDNLKATWRLKDDKGNTFGDPLTVVIVAGQPQAVAAAAQPAAAAVAVAAAAAPIVGGAFELGGQVDSFNFPDKMHYAGMNWVKHQVRWSPGDNPGPVGGVIADAHNKGFKVLLSVLGGAAEAKPANFPSYATFVGGLAKLGPDAIEIWNEENIDREWQNGQVNPTTYTDLLRQAYTAIKNSNPNVMVVSGAPAPTGFFGGCSAAGCDDAPFLAGMAAAGAANYMDCAGIHYNEGIVPPSQTSGDPRTEHYTRYFWGMVNTYYNALGRKLCFTEMGYLSPEGYGKLSPGFAWAQNTSVAQQAQWLAQAASLAAGSGKVRLIIVFNVDFTYWGEDPQAGYAMIRRGGDCPACETLHGVLGSR